MKLSTLFSLWGFFSGMVASVAFTLGLTLWLDLRLPVVFCLGIFAGIVIPPIVARLMNDD